MHSNSARTSCVGWKYKKYSFKIKHARRYHRAGDQCGDAFWRRCCSRNSTRNRSRDRICNRRKSEGNENGASSSAESCGRTTKGGKNRNARLSFGHCHCRACGGSRGRNLHSNFEKEKKEGRGAR